MVYTFFENFKHDYSGTKDTDSESLVIGYFDHPFLYGALITFQNIKKIFHSMEFIIKSTVPCLQGI